MTRTAGISASTWLLTRETWREWKRFWGPRSHTRTSQTSRTLSTHGSDPSCQLHCVWQPQVDSEFSMLIKNSSGILEGEKRQGFSFPNATAFYPFIALLTSFDKWIFCFCCSWQCRSHPVPGKAWGRSGPDWCQSSNPSLCSHRQPALGKCQSSSRSRSWSQWIWQKHVRRM